MGKILQSSITHISFAFVAMGSWAVFANWAHPMPKPLYAGLLQGLMSATITFFLKRTIETLQAKFKRKQALWAPPAVACSASLGLLAGAHILAGTPEVIKTIILPFSVAASYATLYNYLIWKNRKP